MAPRPSNPAPPEALERHFQAASAQPSDINEHLAVLREYASRCDHVTEMGTRWANGSTIALLAGQPETFVAWDLDPRMIVSQRISDLIGMRGRTNFQPRTGNTLEIIIEPTDMLFIDTLHTAKQLQAELIRHADPVAKTVRKYLAFHDTVAFGFTDEDGGTVGLRPVIRWFQRMHACPLWQVVVDAQNNNGLVILEHIHADKLEGRA